MAFDPVARNIFLSGGFVRHHYASPGVSSPIRQLYNRRYSINNYRVAVDSPRTSLSRPISPVAASRITPVVSCLVIDLQAANRCKSLMSKGLAGEVRFGNRSVAFPLDRMQTAGGSKEPHLYPDRRHSND